MSERVELDWQSCFGRCTKGPNVLVQEKSDDTAPGHRFVLAPPPSRGNKVAMYNHVALDDIEEIVSEHLQALRPVRRLLEGPKQSESRSASTNSSVSSDKDGD